MACSDYHPSLSDLVDGVLARDAKPRVEAHLETCADCRALVADLKRMKATARALPKMTAPELVWHNVRAGLDAEPSQARRAPVLQFAPSRRRILTGLAAAAVVVLAVSAGVYFMTRPGQLPAPAAPAAATAATPSAAHANAADTGQSVEAELQLADQHYQKAIDGLEAAAKEGQGALDPKVATALRNGIGVMDQAIAESRAALRAQPTNEAAQASLFEALQRKVGLLRDTIALINEMRKGNQAGAARIAGSLQKG
jgi:anti-sigma factor RsiW